MTNLNKNIKLNRELLLNLFVKFIQKQGKYIKAKKLIVNISKDINSKILHNSSFIFILEYMIYKLFLPMIMVKNKTHKNKYYFLVMSLLKYIKKCVFSPFIKIVRSHKKFPFIYNFLAELQNILKTKSVLIDHKEDVINAFIETNSGLTITNDENIYSGININTTKVYSSNKLKYIKRYSCCARLFSYIKLNSNYIEPVNKHIKNKYN